MRPVPDYAGDVDAQTVPTVPQFNILSFRNCMKRFILHTYLEDY